MDADAWEILTAIEDPELLKFLKSWYEQIRSSYKIQLLDDGLFKKSVDDIRSACTRQVNMLENVYGKEFNTLEDRQGKRAKELIANLKELRKKQNMIMESTDIPKLIKLRKKLVDELDEYNAAHEAQTEECEEEELREEDN